MAAPFRPQFKSFTFKGLVEHFRSVTGAFPDARTGKNTLYSMQDAAIGAFSVFFTQSPSFLDFQRTMQLTKGCSNAQTLFGMRQIPSDVHIRNLLDPVPPSAIFPVFSYIVDGLRDFGYLEAYRSVNGDLLVALDGTQYFTSTKIHCPHCSGPASANYARRSR